MHSGVNSDLTVSSLKSFAPLLVFLAVLSRLLYNYLQLRSIPGPILAGSTNLWRAYLQSRGKLRERIISLHDQYGPVVRYGVNMVSIRDASVIQQIYTTGKGFTIHDSYSTLLGIDKDGKPVESLITVKDESKHGQMRRAIANAFTVTSVGEMESIFDESITQLLHVLHQRVERRQSLDITRQIAWYSLDNAAKMVFSEDAGCLRTDSDAQGLGKMIQSRFMHWGTWSAIPEVERLVYRNPIALRLANSQPVEFSRKAAARYADRIAKPWMSTEPDLLNRLIESAERHPDVLNAKGMMGVIMSTISGAADTTAATLVAILYYLIVNPDARLKLERELTEARVTLPIPMYKEVRHLPYLDAVVKEAMRLFSLVNWPLERRVPPGGMIYQNYVLPPGTSVGVFPAALYMDRSTFGSDVEAFRPERWLSGDGETTRKMEASSLGFSRGKRVCLGQNIATMQLKKVIPTLFLNFTIELQDDSQVLDADFTPAVAFVKPLFVSLSQK
ncbi:uncharacterized protein PV09_08089 [Verruconis gallopava]|uniref:Cytochrome P450 n=1 Tax=Verruconis gallopava TaxID=253628 RepID=A0A0D2AML8_9PEZI|nr:uncharacterized protein PV09_08089 [Verruconis gallopava]KIW00379.1 hypothetical protein PV09_08089 [Verruconis gallopava]